MVEYILGIGHLTEEDCEQVVNDVRERMKGLESAKGSITKELNVLNTIIFQCENRKVEIQKEKGLE